MDTAVMHPDSDIMANTAQVASAYFSNNTVKADDIGNVIQSIRASLMTGGSEPAAPSHEPEVRQEKLEPKVPIKSSVKPEYIICLEDGKKMKMLKRHLNTMYGMTPDQYRQKWGLPDDYPMVAPNYAAKRREMAITAGLGKATGRRRKGTTAKGATRATAKTK